MDVQVLRFWGIVVGAALIALALWIAAMGPERAIAQTSPLQAAQAADAAPGHASFLVRFRGTGPIARAQAAAMRGDTGEAQRRIEIQLQRQRAFAGLCFDRFTAGAAEVVLRTCAPVAGEDRAMLEARWVARLRDMRAVDYADVNAAAAHQRAG